MKDKEENKEDVTLLCQHVYDLAMMSHKQLEPEAMTRFIERSNILLENSTKLSIITIIKRRHKQSKGDIPQRKGILLLESSVSTNQKVTFPKRNTCYSRVVCHSPIKGDIPSVKGIVTRE